MTDKDKLGSAPFEDPDIMEMHKIRLKFFKDRDYTPPQMMAFLSCEFVGSLALGGYSDEFVRKTFDRMYEAFLDHPLRKHHLRQKKDPIV